MIIPNTKRKKALIIVDFQSAFAPTYPHNAETMLANIKKLANTIQYDAFYSTISHSSKRMHYYAQTDYVCDKPEDLIPYISEDDRMLMFPHATFTKSKSSAFKGSFDLLGDLRKREIAELHIGGCDVTNCVMATALEAFDNNFFTYVIEECCAESTRRVPKSYYDAGIKILRQIGLTNHTICEPIETLDI